MRFRLPNQTLTTKVSNAKHGGAYIPTKFLQCDHCGSWFSSIAARRTHIQSRHPQKYREWQLSQLEKGDKRIKLRQQQIKPTEDTTSPRLGKRYPIAADLVTQITDILQETSWPVSKRYKIPGNGCCLGASGNDEKGFLHPLNNKMKSLIQLVNQAIKSALGSRQFYWGSLQINHNTVSQRHTTSY